MTAMKPSTIAGNKLIIRLGVGFTVIFLCQRHMSLTNESTYSLRARYQNEEPQNMNMIQDQDLNEEDHKEKVKSLELREKLLSRIVHGGSHPKWNDESIHAEFQAVIEKIKDAEVIHEPFDHINIANLFSDQFYSDLLDELPPVSTYEEQGYAGTHPMYDTICLAENIDEKLNVPDMCERHQTDDAKCWYEASWLHDMDDRHGKTLAVNHGDLSTKYPLWTQAFRFVHSKDFTYTLTEKFVTDTGIPMYKQKEIVDSDGNIHDLRNSAALRVEPINYHLTPHVDMYEKVVTWQFFHPRSRELEERNVGTQFYVLKDQYKDMINMQTEKNPNWFKYEYFDSVKQHKVTPNYFFAFAPNENSWHGAKITPEQMEGVDKNSRRTFLGFITAKKYAFHHFHQHDWSPVEFDFE